MRWLNKVVRTGRRQDGFTLAEVAIAVLLMAISSIGLLAMFDSSLQLSSLARKSKDAKRIARTVSERIRAMPFYVPYANKDVDVDDSFWGTAEQRGGTATPDITKNDWVNAPYLDYAQDLDPRYTCQVKMAYVLEDLSTPNMKADWVPKASAAEGGKDNPLSVNSDVFHIIKYEVKVSWEARLAGGRTAHKSESYTTLMSDTEFQANLGVNEMINTDTDQLKLGTGGLNSNTAPHDVGIIPIEITGYGFKADQKITASLVMPTVADIPIDNLTRVDDKTLTGKVNLDVGNTAAPPWQPRRDPGKWTVRVDVGLAYAFANEAFMVEFPQPYINSSTPRYGYDNQGPGNKDALLTAAGTKVLNLGAGSFPYTSYTGATIILVKVEDPNVTIQPDPDMPISYVPTSYGGYTSGYSVSAYFDLRGAILGDYYVKIANCKNNRVTLKPGDVISKPDAAYELIIGVGITEFTVPTAASNPFGITAGPDGNIWFTEQAANKIGRIKADGSRVDDFPVYTADSGPTCITAGPDGDLWFTEQAANKIGRMTTDGVCTVNDEFTVPTAASNPFGITAGPDGNIWFTEFFGNQIGRINVSGLM